MNLKGLFAESSIFVKLLLTLFFVIFGMMISGLLSQIVYQLYHVESTTLSYLLDNNIKALKISQFLQSIFTFVLPVVVMAYLTSNGSCHFLSLQEKPGLNLIITTIIVMIVVVPLVNWLANLNANIKLPEFLHRFETWMIRTENISMEITKKFLQTSSFGGLMMNLLQIALVPAICEELFFRGLLQNYFSQSSKNIHMGIWITAIVFSAFHLQFYGFVPRMLLGAYFGYLLVWSGSLWLPVIAHFVHNSIAVVFSFLYDNGYISYNPDKIGLDSTIYTVVISAVLLAGLLYWQKKSIKL